MIRLKWQQKLGLILGSLLLVAVAAVLVVSSLQFTSIPLGTLERAIIILMAVICVANAAFAIHLLVSWRKQKKSFITQQTSGGELRISVAALENLVRQCVDVHEDIKLNQMAVRSVREGVIIELAITLTGNMSIPQVVDGLQSQIKQYLAASSGITVNAVQVAVDAAKPVKGTVPLVETATAEKPVEVAVPDVEQVTETTQTQNEQTQEVNKGDQPEQEDVHA